MLSARTVIAAAAAVVAFAALGLAAWQGYEQRQHNRLSVTPHLGFVDMFERPMGRVDLENDGVGPAVIEDIQVLVDGKEQSPPSVRAAVIAIHGEGTKEWLFVAQLSPGVFIRAGETITMVEIAEDQATRENFDRFVELRRRLSIRIEYTSVYGEETWAAWLPPLPAPVSPTPTEGVAEGQSDREAD